MDVHVSKGAPELCRAAAQRIREVAAAAVGRSGRFAIALSGGTTPAGVYDELAATRDGIDWSKAQIFWSDERRVGPDSPDSNYKLAHDHLLSHLSLAPDQVHRVPGEQPDPVTIARAYEQRIAAVFGAVPGGPPPSFDVVLLGLGTDGHTASLFPRSPALDERARWVIPAYAPEPPRGRITMTLGLINAAHNVLFIVAGTEKALAVSSVLNAADGAVSPPAARVRPVPGQVLFLLDRRAAARIARTVGTHR